eukprot:CAMPEP_0114020374 /NCGR_PEP_ID=MMETSP0372-20130328/17451_1 /TAXON_ID=340204 /ORGANISM="Lankesteria abbotti" /LENGTH=33 /assembly_acc=CAM_ASM_000359
MLQHEVAAVDAVVKALMFVPVILGAGTESLASL